VAEQLYDPPSFKRARTRHIPSGYQIDVPDRAGVRLRLPKNCNAKQFLEAVFRHPKLPMDVRMEAAALALPYTCPKLIMIAPPNINPQQLVITGGLPRMPGMNTAMPTRAQESPEPTTTADSGSVIDAELTADSVAAKAG
jgi:hypothetical protein